MDSDTHEYSLSPAVKLLIMAASLALASSVGFFLHPHLLPFLSHSLPQLYSAAHAWLTAPFLFLLLNLVVASLFFTSRILSLRPHPPPKKNPLRSRSPSPTPPSTAVVTDQVPEAVAAPPPPPANSSKSSAGGGLRARIEKSKTFSRLVRSKSEQIPPSLTRMEVGSGSRLKKAGTFEGAAQGSRKPMVIVADPPEDEDSAPPAGHEEVDKKAEDFISRFYQKVKLQRLDSLLRSQQQGRA